MKLSILEYIDFQRLDELLESFNKTTGFVTAVIDLNGNILSKSGWGRICSDIHDAQPNTIHNCNISDIEVAQVDSNKNYKLYHCKIGLYEMSVPIMIDGEHIANIFTGQFLLEEPDLSFFREKAKKYHLDEDQYIEAVQELPIVNISKIEDVVEHLLSIVEIIIDLTMDKIESLQTHMYLTSSIDSLSNVIIFSLDQGYNYLFFNEVHKNAMKVSYNANIEVGKNIFEYISDQENIDRIKKNFDIALSGESHRTLQKFGENEVNYYETDYNPIKDKDNHIIGATAFSKNVSDRVNMVEKLEESEKRFRRLFDNAPFGYQSLDETGHFIDVNQKWLEILGYQEEDVIGKWFGDFLSDEMKIRFKKRFSQFKENGSIHSEFLMKTKSGQDVRVGFEGKISYNKNHEFIQTHCTLSDITEIKIATQKLKDSEQRYRELINSLDAGVVVHNPDATIKSFNLKAEEILELSSSELEGIKASSKQFNFISEDHQKLDYSRYPVEIISRTLNPLTNYTMGIVQSKHKNVVWVSVNGIPIFDHDMSIKEIVISFSDITDEKNKRDEIIYLSNHDFLTQLHNRRYLVTQYNQLNRKENYPLGIMMLDVNGLKIINDAYGHQAGDYALKRVSSIIKSACREQDIICRIGGDEFAVILINVTSQIVNSIIETIREKTSNEQVFNIPLSLAIGYKIKTGKVESNLDDLLKIAENDMYRHKLTESISIRNHAIKAILKTLTEKYDEEKVHSKRVSQLCKEIGIHLNLGQDEIKELALAGMYHDIGKISIPDAILKKPGKLTNEEYRVIKTHPEISYQILRAADEYTDLAIHALYHHERWDGKGYPSGLKGEKIPLFSRIICVVDAFEAMTSERVYKKSMSIDLAVQEIVRCSGTQFDKDIAKVFVEKVLKKKWQQINNSL